MVAACLNGADDYLELQVGIAFIEPYLKIRGRIVIVKIHRAPFDIEDSIGRTAAYRSVNATGSAGETGAARLRIGAQVGPVWEDCNIMATPRQANAR
jgi:hypothetical protein